MIHEVTRKKLREYAVHGTSELVKRLARCALAARQEADMNRRLANAALDWRRDDDQHKSDCDCAACVRLGCVLDEALAKLEKEERRG